MRRKLSLLSLSVYLAMTVAAHAMIPPPAIDLNADNLAQGDVVQWVNSSSCSYGLAGRKFIACGQPPTCTTFMGKTGVYCTGVNGFISQPDANGVPWALTDAAGADFSGSAPYTVSFWALNPSYQNSYETVFAWTNRVGANMQKACFFMGTQDSYGAINHWGTVNDMGYDRGIPQAGVWHSVVMTYSGLTGWEKVYVDGVINAIERKPSNWLNNIESGDPIYIGLTDDTAISSNFSGYIHSIQVYPGELNNDDVLTVAGLTPVSQMPSVPTLANPSFELVQGDIWVVPTNSTNVNRCDSRTIPGWAYVPQDPTNPMFMDGSARRAGIGVNVPNRGMVPGGGWWDNGLNVDGSRVLALVGQSNIGRAVSQYVYLKQGKTYHIHVYYNCAATGTAELNIGVYDLLNQKVATPPNMPVSVSPVEGQWSWTVPFYDYGGNFSVGTSGQYAIQISNDQPSDTGSTSALLIDKVELYESNPPKPMGGWPYPDTIDFGNVQGGSVKGTKDLAFHVQNMGGANLNLTFYSRTGTDANSVDFIDSVKPGTNGSTPNIIIPGYQSTDLHVRFTATTGSGGQKAYSGNLMVRYTNGTFAADQYMPWVANVPKSPVVTNGSFESPYNANEQYSGTAYYANYGQSYLIPGWLDTATSHGIGVGDRNNGQNVNYGNVPDGHQALWIQGFMPDNMNYHWYAGKSRSVSQVVPGFVANRAYKIVMYVNARSQGNNRCYFQFKINGNAVAPVSYPSGVTNNGTFNGIPTVMSFGRNGGNWYRLEYDYKPSSEGSARFELVNVFDTSTSNLGESCLNVDAIKVYDMTAPQAARAAHTTALGYWNSQYMGNGYPVNFGTSTSGITSNQAQLPIRVYNEGGTTLTITSAAITGQNARDFRLFSKNPPLPLKIAGAGLSGGNYSNPNNSGGVCDFYVQFQPSAIDVGGIGSAYLTLGTDDTTKTINVPLTGWANNFPVILNADFQQPPVYWDNTGTIWRCLGTNIGPAGWNQSSGLTGVPPVDNYGANNTGVGDRICVTAPINNTYQTSFYDNNGNPNQTQVCFIQTGTSGQGGSMAAPKGVWQNVDGFQAGNTYHVKALVNARYTAGAPNDNTVRGVVLHYKSPSGTTNGGKWVNLADPTDVTNIDPQFTYATPYKAIEGDIVCDSVTAATGRYQIELWVPQQSFDESLLVQSITISGPPPKAVKSWNMFE